MRVLAHTVQAPESNFGTKPTYTAYSLLLELISLLLGNSLPSKMIKL